MYTLEEPSTLKAKLSFESDDSHGLVQADKGNYNAEIEMVLYEYR